MYILKNNYPSTYKYSFNYKENTIKLNRNDHDRLLNLLHYHHNLTSCTNENNQKEKDSHKLVSRSFYETTGIVCSFNCMWSYLDENYNDPMFANSKHLIYSLYKHIFGDFPSQSFTRSPSWKLRKEFGGPLADEDYQKCIQNIVIIDSKQTKNNNQNKTEHIYEVLI